MSQNILKPENKSSYQEDEKDAKSNVVPHLSMGRGDEKERDIVNSKGPNSHTIHRPAWALTEGVAEVKNLTLLTFFLFDIIC